jgi:hypothetical protein
MLRRLNPPDQNGEEASPKAGYLLRHGDREVPLRARDPDSAMREALSIAGVVIACARTGATVVGGSLCLTEFILADHLPLTPKRLRDFSSMPRPISLDTLGYLRLPARIWTDRVDIAGNELPVALLVAKVLNRDDGVRLRHHEWAARVDAVHRELLATPP